jgi:hypothetical protein
MSDKKMKAFLVVSRFLEDISWVSSLTDNYIIYNRGEVLPDCYNQKNVENIGGNQYDIFSFIYENYENLPDLIAFTQGNPFDHCLPERFYNIIYNTEFTTLFGDSNYVDGVYSEPNSDWYIVGAFNSHNPPSKFSSFDDYMNYMFEDYSHESNLVFPPGSQIMVEKERCLFYSKHFWKKLMDEVTCKIPRGGIEAHIIERSIQIIFENKYKEKK